MEPGGSKRGRPPNLRLPSEPKTGGQEHAARIAEPNRFLISQGVDPAIADEIGRLAKRAIRQYSDEIESPLTCAINQRVRADEIARNLFKAAEAVSRADDALWNLITNAHIENVEGLPGPNWHHLREIWEEQIRHRAMFATNLRRAALAAKEAAKRLAKPGRPMEPKRQLFDKLALLWATAKNAAPKASKSATIDRPQTTFGRFVAVCLLDAGLSAEFERGFGDALKQARDKFLKINPSYGAEPTTK